MLIRIDSIFARSQNYNYDRCQKEKSAYEVEDSHITQKKYGKVQADMQQCCNQLV